MRVIQLPDEPALLPSVRLHRDAWRKGWLQQAIIQWPVDWLKSYITLGTHDNTAWLPGFDGDVLLSI